MLIVQFLYGGALHFGYDVQNAYTNARYTKNIMYIFFV